MLRCPSCMGSYHGSHGTRNKDLNRHAPLPGRGARGLIRLTPPQFLPWGALIECQEPRETIQQTQVTVAGDRAQNTEEPIGRHGRQETEANDRRRFETTPDKVRIRHLDHVVESHDLLMNLRTDPADKPVAEGWHPPQKDGRAWLDTSIRLRQRREPNIAFVHHFRLRSAVVYSGSSSP